MYATELTSSAGYGAYGCPPPMMMQRGLLPTPYISPFAAPPSRPQVQLGLPTGPRGNDNVLARTDNASQVNSPAPRLMLDGFLSQRQDQAMMAARDAETALEHDEAVDATSTMDEGQDVSRPGSAVTRVKRPYIKSGRYAKKDMGTTFTAQPIEGFQMTNQPVSFVEGSPFSLGRSSETKEVGETLTPSKPRQKSFFGSNEGASAGSEASAMTQPRASDYSHGLFSLQPRANTGNASASREAHGGSNEIETEAEGLSRSMRGTSNLSEGTNPVARSGGRGKGWRKGFKGTLVAGQSADHLKKADDLE